MTSCTNRNSSPSTTKVLNITHRSRLSSASRYAHHNFTFNKFSISHDKFLAQLPLVFSPSALAATLAFHLSNPARRYVVAFGDHPHSTCAQVSIFRTNCRVTIHSSLSKARQASAASLVIGIVRCTERRVKMVVATSCDGYQVCPVSTFRIAPLNNA
jgi:uncharacterized protein YgbK (DUF1537 family)